MKSPATVVLDCRWLSIGGPGRTTELLLRGLAEGPPPEGWILWGPEATAPLAWDQAMIAPISEDPRVLLGQRRARSMPPARLAVFMHQQRPLRNVAAVTVIYDTIALRHGANRLARLAKRQFLRRIARTSRHIVTISEHSRASIVQDLGVAPDRVSILRFPFDAAFADRVTALRQALPQEPVALYVGGFLPHKNLPRLIAAFGRTRFCRDGGRLVLTGGTDDQVRELVDHAGGGRHGFVDARPACDQADLDRLFATSRFLVQPSLEEGFGLPAWEALSCGLPVCASDGGALPEVVAGFVDPFPAADVAAMTTAIDACAGDPGNASAASAASDQVRRRAPTIKQFADQFRGIVDRHVR